MLCIYCAYIINNRAFFCILAATKIYNKNKNRNESNRRQVRIFR